MIKELFEACYICQADKVPSEHSEHFQTGSKPPCPGSYWTCDVMKHGKKNILVCTENFSSFTVCKILPSEKHIDCENAIISSIFPFKIASGKVNIRVDTAPGMSAIINRSSDDLQKADIFLEPGHAKNKNSLGKVDKTIAELRSILRTLSPEGSPLSNLDLQRAVETLNTRIRSSNLSAREIMFSRLQNSNENITLDDLAISNALFDQRIKANNYVNKSSNDFKPCGKPIFIPSSS